MDEKNAGGQPEIIVTSAFAFYDKEETYRNCTVQVLTNTRTGECSVGWWKNDPDVDENDFYNDGYEDEEDDDECLD